MTSQLRAVLFDVDGTLIDTVSMIVEALDETFRKHLGVAFDPDELRSTIGLPLSKQVHFFDDRPGVDVSGVDYVQLAADQIAAYEERKHRETLIPDAIEALKRCKQKGYRIALVTSKNKLEMDLAWPRLELNDFVDAVVTSSDVEHPKPAPDSAILAAEQLNVSPAQTLFIGDATYDIACGKSAGALTAAVAWGAHGTKPLKDASPDWFFETPSQLLQWCEQLPSLSITDYAPQEKTRN